MIEVYTEIEINAPIDVCFDLARNIDVHTQTVWKHTRERAVAGCTSGMIEDGETVTFQATHFGVRQKLTSAISEFNRPYRFVDQMVSGAFRSLRHEHDFEWSGSSTIMKDTLRFSAPFGLVGWVVERIVLKRYMLRFIEHRNIELKKLAESVV